MKNFTLLLISSALMISLNISAQENIDLPFFDGFEQAIGDDAVFENWTSENLEGWHYWHIIPWNGNPGQCMRFENTDLDQNDWLVTKPINCEGVNQVKVNFDTWFQNTGIKPKLFYTDSYNGDASQSSWTELEYSLGETETAWHSSADIIIDDPENIVYLAFQYHAAANEGIYFLLDNFEVEEYIPIEPYELVGSSEHFEFYTNLPDETDYWLEIKDALEENFTKYCGHWNIPGLDDFIDNNTPAKVYFTEKENIPYATNETPDWKSGFFKRETKSIYISPLNTDEKIIYYENLTNLALHTFAGYAHIHRLYRDRDGWDYEPEYYTEAFGLYEMGYRPNHDSIVSFLQKHQEALTHEHLDNFTSIHNSSEKDIAVSYVEGQILLTLGYRYCEAPYGSYPPIWNNYLTYFYDTTDNVQIKKYDASENFDIYCSSRDTMFIDSMKVWLEKTRMFYVDSFQMEINVRYPLLIMYDEQTGIDLTGYDNFNGGSASLNISPHNFWGGIEGYNWLLAHEFGHIFNSLMYSDFPSGFYHEGMANFSGYNMDGMEHLDDLWKIQYVFDYYQNTYSRDPTLNEIIYNPDAGQPGLEYGIDCYFFGFEFMRFLKKTEGYLKMKEFFNAGLDFTVFNMSYEEIEIGYINYLKAINPNAVNQTYFNNEFKVYPNPLTDASIISFKTKSDGNVTLSVCNLKGQKILTIVDAKLAQGKYKYQIDKSKLTPGIYIVSLSTPLYQSNIKLIVND